MKQLRTIAATINGQQLVYIVFSKWTNDGRCLDGTSTFVECYVKRNHLYKLYAEEVMYLRRNQTGLLRHGGSYNCRFQLSSDLLWRPDRDDAGVRLAAVEDAIDKSIVRLADAGAKGYSRSVAERCWSELQSVDNFGETLAQQCIQMSARLGLCPASFCEFATVDGSMSSNAGPTLFLRQTCPCRISGKTCICTASQTKLRFHSIIDSLLDHRLAITDLIGENTACIAWRTFGKKDDRKPDLLFWDKYCDPASFQNIIVYCSRKSRKHHRKLVVLFRGEWKDLDDVISFEMDLHHWSQNQDTPDFFKWNRPEWSNFTIYPQQPLK